MKNLNLMSMPFWQRCNDMVLSWILNSLEPDLVESILSCNTPRAIWEDLREKFSLGNAPHIFHIQRDIYRIEQGQMSVSVYSTKLKGLWDELSSYNSAACTCDQNDRTKLMQFLMGLNETYSGTREQILLMNPLPSVRQAYTSVKQEEKQRELGSSAVPSNMAAMMVRSSNNNWRQKTSTPGNQNKEPFACTYCGGEFHREATCWKKNGYPPGHPKHKSVDEDQSLEAAANKTWNSFQGHYGKKSGNYGNRTKRYASANSVDASNQVPSLQELQDVLPNLNEAQYVQVITAMNPKATAPQANAASASLFEFSEGLGYEDNDWCG
ncbi:uncharacterized protein LOC121049758 [Rosa chinensis]|uniref:uncharacterized protein LOC121049758 n=1 Tax=Rosa chinensis TaxID=74649 RepID=UPI001AD90A57|nr:uncharacterized protein LOC121049758 [Rosa chinensis]